MLRCLQAPRGGQSPGTGDRLRRRPRALGPSLGREGALGCGEEGEPSPQTPPYKPGWIHQAGVRAHSEPKGCSRLSPSSPWSSEPSLVFRRKPGPSQSRPVSPPAPLLLSRSRGTLEALSPRTVEALPGFPRTGALEDLHLRMQQQEEIQPLPPSPLSPVPRMPAHLGSATPGPCGQLEERKEPRGGLGLCPPRLPEGVRTEATLGA